MKKVIFAVAMAIALTIGTVAQEPSQQPTEAELKAKKKAWRAEAKAEQEAIDRAVREAKKGRRVGEAPTCFAPAEQSAPTQSLSTDPDAVRERRNAIAAELASLLHHPQEIKDGDFQQIKNLRKVYIAADNVTSATLKDEILRREFPTVQAVDDPAEADYFLVYFESMEKMSESTSYETRVYVSKDGRYARASSYPDTRTTYANSGSLQLFKQTADNTWERYGIFNKVRTYSNGYTFNRPPAYNAIREYLKFIEDSRGCK